MGEVFQRIANMPIPNDEKIVMPLLGLALNSVAGAIIVVDCCEKVVFCSNGFAALWGCEVNEITGTPLGEALGLIAKKVDQPEILVQNLKLLEENQDAECSFEFDLLNDETCRMQAITLREGLKSFGKLLEFRCGPEMETTKKEMGADHMKYDELFNTAPFGLMQYGSAGKMSHANNTLAELFGYESKSEMAEIVNRTSVGQSVFLNQQQEMELNKKALACKGEWLFKETRFRRKDGSIFDGELFLRATEFKDTVFQGFVRDISTRKKVEIAFQENQKRFRSSFQLLKTLIDSHSDSFDPTTIVESPQPLPQASRLVEMSYIENALRKTGGKVQPAARILGISRYALIRQIAKMGIDPKNYK